MSNFQKVKNYLLDLGHDITESSEENGIFVINDPEKGIVNMVLDCETTVLVIEQVICPLNTATTPEQYKQLLQCNRDLVHGAFVIDDQGEYLLFRDTLEMENMDISELESAINALTLGLAEHYHILLEVAGVDTISLANQN